MRFENKWNLLNAVIIGCFILVLFFIARQNNLMQQKFNKQIEELDNKITALSTNSNSSSTAHESAELKSNLDVEVKPVPEQEVKMREVIRQKSQDELLTAAVEKNTSAVVSIVLSKDVPQYEVVYQNPFGNDPFFKDVQFRVPTYKQKGTVQQKVGAGTGFIVSTDGYIITNKHVIYDDKASYTVLLADGRQLPATLVYRDPSNDLGIIKIQASGLSKVSLGDSTSLKLGQTVIAIGNALGEYNNSVSTGIISGLNRTIQASGASGSEQLKGVIQTDTAINPGNSGGPLLDLEGNVMGVNVATVTGSNSISFSIPINEIKPILQAYLK